MSSADWPTWTIIPFHNSWNGDDWHLWTDESVVKTFKGSLRDRTGSRLVAKELMVAEQYAFLHEPSGLSNLLISLDMGAEGWIGSRSMLSGHSEGFRFRKPPAP